MNWIYTWYRPRLDPDAEVLARQFSDIFLSGIRAGGKSRHDDSGQQKKTVPRKSTGARGHS
jgi:hypothetical protein